MKPVEIKQCEICTKSVKAYGSVERRATKKFCSRVCRGKHQTNIGVLIKSCLKCGQTIKISGSQKKKGFGFYCSFKCYGISKRSPYYKPDENHKIRTSWDYTKWRTSVYKRDNFTCQDCGKRGIRLEADHIKPFAFFPELRFELSNGRTLCKDCHKKTPTYGGRNYKV